MQKMLTFESEQEMLTHTFIEIKIIATCSHWKNEENLLHCKVCIAFILIQFVRCAMGSCHGGKKGFLHLIIAYMIVDSCTAMPAWRLWVDLSGLETLTTTPRKSLERCAEVVSNESGFET
jgi:hypothetical protein